MLYHYIIKYIKNIRSLGKKEVLVEQGETTDIDELLKDFSDKQIVEIDVNKIK